MFTFTLVLLCFGVAVADAKLKCCNTGAASGAPPYNFIDSEKAERCLTIAEDDDCDACVIIYDTKAAPTANFAQACIK